MLDCEFAPLTGEYFRQALDGGMKFNPGHRHYDDDGKRRAGKIRFTGDSLRETSLRDVEWKKGAICNHYEYKGETDTHDFYFTTPDLLGVNEGAMCPGINLADVADNWPEGLKPISDTISIGDLQWDPTSTITINPKTINPVIPTPATPWTTPAYPASGGWYTYPQTTVTGGGTTSSNVTIGSSAFDSAINFPCTSGYVDIDPGAKVKDIKAQLNTLVGSSLVTGLTGNLTCLFNEKDKKKED